jgi:hypothetical protein
MLAVVQNVSSCNSVRMSCMLAATPVVLHTLDWLDSSARTLKS